MYKKRCLVGRLLVEALFAQCQQAFARLARSHTKDLLALVGDL